MAKLKDFGGLVFSTNPEQLLADDIVEQEQTLQPEKQKLRIAYERAGRGGKEVTIVRGFVGCEEDLLDIAKRLKQSCGCGGSAKNKEVIIQGDKRERIITLLKEWGYLNTK